MVLRLIGVREFLERLGGIRIRNNTGKGNGYVLRNNRIRLGIGRSMSKCQYCTRNMYD